MNYFKKLPVVNHSNTLVRNIMTRVALSSNSSFFEYNIKEGFRSDTLAKKYYDSYNYEWLVLLSNHVVDPYYDMGLSNQDFEKYIVAKYGSLANAQSTILYYKNDWESDNSIISTAAYAAYTEDQKKYWQPSYDYAGRIIGYERKKEDWIINTNRVVSLTVNSHSYSIGDTITQANSSASGAVISSNSTVVLLQHIEGEFDLSVMSGNVTPTATDILQENISSVEDHYWTTVDAYTYETELNESNKNILLLDNRLKSQAEEEIKNLFD